MTRFLAVLVLVLGAGTLAAGERAGTLTPEQVVFARSVRSVAVAPDGKLLAYTVRVPRAADEERGSAYSEVWVVDRDGESHRRFTPEHQRAWAPAFSPDGRSLAFLSTRDIPGTDKKEGTADLFVMPVNGGEARPLTDGTRSIRSFRWSPQGDRIAFTAKPPRTDEEKKARKRGQDWIVGERELRPMVLWMLDVASGKVERVIDSDVNVWNFDWDPDGSRLVVQVSDSPRADEWYLYSRLALVPATGGEPAPLVATVGKLQHPRFSPDGAFVAWLGAHDLNDPYPGNVFVVSAAGGEARELDAGDAATATSVGWSSGRNLLVAKTRGTDTVIERVDIETGKRRTVVPPSIVFTGFTVSRNGKTLALVGNTPTNPNEVYAGTLGGRAKLERLTVTDPDVEQVQLARQEVVRWKAQDDVEVEGVLLYPLGFKPGVRYPLVVQVHGGPESCYRNGWVTSYSRWGQMLAQRGIMVLLPNYRGSIGRGEAFETGDHQDLGGQEFGDVLAGIDMLVERGWVDGERVGIGGGSYGGYFSAWAATAHSDRFAAAVDFAGISNWISMQGTSDIPEENALVHWALPFYDNMNLYWERSPLSHVKNCNTPLLIAHGDADARVPLGQGVELFTALRLLGKEVELVRYPRAGHGLSESAHQLDYLKRSLAWFEDHLKREPQTVHR